MILTILSIIFILLAIGAFGNASSSFFKTNESIYKSDKRFKSGQKKVGVRELSNEEIFSNRKDAKNSLMFGVITGLIGGLLFYFNPNFNRDEDKSKKIEIPDEQSRFTDPEFQRNSVQIDFYSGKNNISFDSLQKFNKEVYGKYLQTINNKAEKWKGNIDSYLNDGTIKVSIVVHQENFYDNDEIIGNRKIIFTNYFPDLFEKNYVIEKSDSLYHKIDLAFPTEVVFSADIKDFKEVKVSESQYETVFLVDFSFLKQIN